MTPFWCQSGLLEQEMRTLIADRLGLPVERVTSQDRLRDLGVTYAAWLELALAVEEAFDVSLCERELRRAQTVGQWVEMIERAAREGRCGAPSELELPGVDEQPSELPPPSALPPSALPPSVEPPPSTVPGE
jgi:acyl carrier protein